MKYHSLIKRTSLNRQTQTNPKTTQNPKVGRGSARQAPPTIHKLKTNFKQQTI